MAKDSAGAVRPTLSNQHAAALEAKRRIPCEIAATLGIVSRGNAVGFEYTDPETEALLWTKWRSPEKKFWIEPQGAKLLPWNLQSCRELNSTGGTLVITEGEFDAAACVAAGYPCVISVPNGAPPARGDGGDITPATDTTFAYLWNDKGVLRAEIDAAKRIILATDGDEPGKALAAELAVRLGLDRCAITVWPAGTKDPNEVLVRDGVEGLRSVLETAVDLVPDKLVDWEALPSSGNVEGLSTGWGSIDPMLKLTFPELVIVTGKPNAGKSRWTLAWVMNLARLHGVKTTYVSLEDSADRLKRHTYQYAKTWEGSEMTTRQGEVFAPIPKGKAIDWLKHHMRFIAPSVTEDDTRDLEWLKRIIWEARNRHGCQIIVLDPWNELEHMWDRRGMGIDEYINAALRDLKRLARRYNIAIVILAHPDKAGGRNEDVDEMTLYSISGGASWKNKADGGIIIAKEISSKGETGNTIVKVDKRKDRGIMGQPGQAVLEFNEATGLYTST